MSISCSCRFPEKGLKNFAEVLAHLNGLGLFHMEMGLERMRGALEKLGLTRFPCPSVQIVGTNGKGSGHCGRGILRAVQGICGDT